MYENIFRLIYQFFSFQYHLIYLNEEFPRNKNIGMEINWNCWLAKYNGKHYGNRFQSVFISLQTQYQIYWFIPFHLMFWRTKKHTNNDKNFFSYSMAIVNKFDGQIKFELFLEFICNFYVLLIKFDISWHHKEQRYHESIHFWF